MSITYKRVKLKAYDGFTIDIDPGFIIEIRQETDGVLIGDTEYIMEFYSGLRHPRASSVRLSKESYEFLRSLYLKNLINF